MPDEQVTPQATPQPYTAEETVAQEKAIRSSAERKAAHEAMVLARRAAKDEKKRLAREAQFARNGQVLAQLDAYLAAIEKKMEENPNRSVITIPVPGNGPDAALLAKFAEGRLMELGYNTHTKRYPSTDQPLDENGRINWSYYQVVFC